jgi:predicted nucleic acid-binding protein
MNAKVFIDTNVLVYFFAEAGYRTQLAEQLLSQGGVISVQVLNEAVSVARRKLKMSWDEVCAVRDDALVFCPEPAPLTLQTHQAATAISARYGYPIYDGLIVASALETGCSTLYTEDLQHGQVIEAVRIVNPFL